MITWLREKCRKKHPNVVLAAAPRTITAVRCVGRAASTVAVNVGYHLLSMKRPNPKLFAHDRQLTLQVIATKFVISLMDVLQHRTSVCMAILTLEVRDEMSATDAFLEAEFGA